MGQFVAVTPSGKGATAGFKVTTGDITVVVDAMREYNAASAAWGEDDDPSIGDFPAPPAVYALDDDPMQGGELHPVCPLVSQVGVNHYRVSIRMPNRAMEAGTFTL